MTIKFLIRKWNTPPCGTFVYDIALIPNCSTITKAKNRRETERRGSLPHEKHSSQESCCEQLQAPYWPLHPWPPPHPTILRNLGSSLWQGQQQPSSQARKSSPPSCLPLTENCITMFYISPSFREYYICPIAEFTTTFSLNGKCRDLWFKKAIGSKKARCFLPLSLSHPRKIKVISQTDKRKIIMLS